MQSEQLIRELPKGLLKWYMFQQGASVLYISCHLSYDDILIEALIECGLKVDNMDLDNISYIENLYDYVVLVGALECNKNPVQLLTKIYSILNKDGKLILGLQNRLGIRYFCGDKDFFTGRIMDGIDNYARVSVAARKEMIGHAYSKFEYVDMLEKAGFYNYHFYSVLPGLERMQALYSEDYLPKEELEVRIIPQYHSSDTVFIQEEKLYKSLIENGMFHSMANGYFVECSMNQEVSNVKQVTISLDRGQEDAMATIIRYDGFVEKKALYQQGSEKLNLLIENTNDLKEHGLHIIEMKQEEQSLIMPYINAETATEYFRKILLENKELFLQEMDRFWKLILNSSEYVPYEEINWEQFEPYWYKRKTDDPNKDKWKNIAFGTKEEQENLGVILKKGYIDLVCLNCFYVDGEFVFYDQEVYVENLPAKVILWRTINLIYWNNPKLESCIPQLQLYQRYHMDAYIDLWSSFSWEFIERFRKEKELASYHQLYRPNISTIDENRLRMNYSQKEYERLFRDIFKGIENKKLYLFGSGKYTKRFLELYSKEYDITGILDNNSDKWGTQLEGYEITSPEILRNLSEDSYKVIICIKHYAPIMEQLNGMGIKDYGIYDINISYSRKQRVLVKIENDSQNKKYQVGYIAGVFDLFHVGHLNMFKRAKEQCEYLIVGVVTDESVMRDKKTMPFIPFEERIEIVRSCKYVDEAVEIPLDRGDTDEAYHRYQFDVQFSGSDYEDDPIWLAKKTFLQKHGSDLIFFPYTQSTSSTKLKSMIDKTISQK